MQSKTYVNDDETVVRLFLKVFNEEREELKATLDAQDQFVRSSGAQQQQLRREVTRLHQALQAKEQVIR